MSHQPQPPYEKPKPFPFQPTMQFMPSSNAFCVVDPYDQARVEQKCTNPLYPIRGQTNFAELQMSLPPPGMVQYPIQPILLTTHTMLPFEVPATLLPHQQAAHRNPSNQNVSYAHAETKFGSILNRLDSDNFKYSVKQIKTLSDAHQLRLQRCINLLVGKAISRPWGSSCYADLCYEISKMYVPQGNQNITFRCVLSRQCQIQLNILSSNPLKQLDEVAQHNQSKYEEISPRLFGKNGQILRQSAQIAIKFFAELYELDLLNSFVMIQCLKMLWDLGDNTSLEMLCDALMTAGDTKRGRNFLVEMLQQKESDGSK